jgi:hypothetical protein
MIKVYKANTAQLIHDIEMLSLVGGLCYFICINFIGIVADVQRERGREGGRERERERD